MKGIVFLKGRVVTPVIECDLASARINEKYFVPMYDSEGNLVWPKQMSYEEVKKFVAERDAKRQNKEIKNKKDSE